MSIVAREKKPKPISLRAYARRRGVSAEAVSKAVKDDRLVESVVLVDGKPKIIDVELADREWKMNTRSRIDDDDDDDDGEVGIDVPSYKRSVAIRAAHAARRESALADLAEIEVAEKRDELVPAAEVREYFYSKFTVVKTRILGVPSRVAQQLPHVAAEVMPVVEALLREALEELSVEDDDGDGEEDEDA